MKQLIIITEDRWDSTAVFTGKQITFINQIIDHLVLNGMMEPAELFRPPFTDKSDNGIIWVLPNKAEVIVKVIEAVNSNVDMAM